MNPPPPVPDHELLRVIGRGSYGEVWLARNIMGVLRAVKVVHRSKFDRDRPYEREFSGVQRYEPLSRTSDGLVQVLHVGRNDSVRCFYYVMELADDANDSTGVFVQAGTGVSQPIVRDTADYVPRTLRCDLERVPRLPVEECVAIGRSLATGLAQLHRHRLVHRDLKPSNVIFVNGRARLADIGLVAGLDESRSFVGTEGFVPPEGPGSAAADLFALGRTLYQAATGLDPERFPEIPSDWLDAPDASALIEFHEVILKLGEGSYARRYQTTTEVLADLALIESGKSVRELRTLARRVVWLRRAGLAALIVLALAAAAGLWARGEARRERENFERVAEAERRARRELINSYLARARTERLASGLGRRDASLGVLTNAATLAPDADQRRALRSEAAATLAQRGLRWVPASASLESVDPMSVACDPSQEFGARWNADGSLTLHRLVDGQVAGLIPPMNRLPDEVVGLSASRRFLLVRRGEERWVADFGRGTYCQTNAVCGFAPDEGLWRTEADGTLRLVSLPAGTPLKSFPCPAELVSALPWRSMAVSPEGGRVAVAGTDGRVAWWDADTGELGGSFRSPTEVYALAWSAASDRLAVGTTSGEVAVWHLPDPHWRWLVRAQTSAIRRLAFAADGRLLAVAGENEVLNLHDADTGRALASLPAIAWQLSFRRADSRLALVWRGGKPGFIELTPPVGFQLRRSSREAAADGALAFSSDGRWLAAGTVATVDLWAHRLGRIVASLPAAGVRALAFSPEPTSLWWLDDQGIATLPLGVDPAPPTDAIQRDASRPWTHFALAGGTDALVLADGTADALVLRRTGQGDRRLEPHQFVRFAALSRGGELLASGSQTLPGVRVWEERRDWQSLPLPSGLNVRPAFSPDGRWLAVAGPTCSIWEGPDWTAGPRLPDEPANTVAGTVAFSPDSALLAALYGDREIRLFRLPEAVPDLTLEAPGGARVLAIAFSPEGSTLAATTTEGEVLLWELRELREALARLGLAE